MLRHASTPHGTITIDTSGRDIRVTGRNPATTTAGTEGGHGLVGMRERVRAHGGKLRNSLAGGVFTVTAEVPA